MEDLVFLLLFKLPENEVKLIGSNLPRDVVMKGDHIYLHFKELKHSFDISQAIRAFFLSHSTHSGLSEHRPRRVYRVQMVDVHHL